MRRPLACTSWLYRCNERQRIDRDVTQKSFCTRATASRDSMEDSISRGRRVDTQQAQLSSPQQQSLSLQRRRPANSFEVISRASPPTLSREQLSRGGDLPILSTGSPPLSRQGNSLISRPVVRGVVLSSSHSNSCCDAAAARVATSFAKGSVVGRLPEVRSQLPSTTRCGQLLDQPLVLSSLSLVPE